MTSRSARLALIFPLAEPLCAVPADKLWGAQTQRSLEHFSIGQDLIPREMILLKKAAARANHDGKRLGDEQFKLIVQVCDEILAGKHHDMFPLQVWMTGAGLTDHRKLPMAKAIHDRITP